MAVMLTATQKEYNTTAKRLELLQKKLASERAASFRNIHKEFGFGSPSEFVAAYNEAMKIGTHKTVAKAKTQRRKRAKVTVEMVEKAKKLFASKQTVADVAKAIGVSQPTAHNIKKKLGLVKAGAKAEPVSKK